jgi:hypothetical protein
MGGTGITLNHHFPAGRLRPRLPSVLSDTQSPVESVLILNTARAVPGPRALMCMARSKGITTLPAHPQA